MEEVTYRIKISAPSFPEVLSQRCKYYGYVTTMYVISLIGIFCKSLADLADSGTQR